MRCLIRSILSDVLACLHCIHSIHSIQCTRVLQSIESARVLPSNRCSRAYIKWTCPESHSTLVKIRKRRDREL
jgi:hypothetical protein